MHSGHQSNDASQTPGTAQSSGFAPPEDLNNSSSDEKAFVKKRKPNLFLFTVTWICGVLAAAASVVFGVWAPLSYKATADGNRENSEIQSSLVAAVTAANGIANAALSTASAQMNVLEDTQSRIDAMGKLELLRFCQPLTVGVNSPCFLAGRRVTSRL